MQRLRALVGVIVAIVLLIIVSANTMAQQSLKVRVDRWLEVKQIVNTVTIEHDAISRTARPGDRLMAVNDSITTGQKSSATLFVDTGIGVIEIAEQTTMRVKALDVAPDNGRITHLEVLNGNARLRVRHFTHEGSQLEIRTPVGLSGVRGTTFGVAVQPNGKTGLAVREGRVMSSAQGRSVGVPGGRQNFTMPGEPPSNPVPLTNDTSLRYNFEKHIERGVRNVRLLGQVDPVNSVTVDGMLQVTDRYGQFRTDLRPVPTYLTIQVIVTTPLGKKQTHVLALQ